MRFAERLRSAYEIAARDVPKIDEHKVEKILKGNDILTREDLATLKEASRYWSHIIDISDADRDEDVIDNALAENDRLVERLEKSLHNMKRQRMRIVKGSEPKLNEHKVEKILKGKGDLSPGDLKELNLAIDYWDHVNEISDDKHDGDVIENVTKELQRIIDRLEDAGVDLNGKPVEVPKKRHLRLASFQRKVFASYRVMSCEGMKDNRRRIEAMLSRSEVVADLYEPLVQWRVERFTS